MEFFRRLFGRSRLATAEEAICQAGAHLDRSRLRTLFERAPSFSVVIFEGDATGYLPDLLAECGYKIRRAGRATGTLLELSSQMKMPSGSGNSIVQKGYFRTATHTVLIEPEMVLITRAEELSRTCRTHDTRVLVAIWERASESVVLAEFTQMGLARQTWYCQGAPTEEQVDPHPEIVEQPDADGLKAALNKSGVLVEHVFGSVDATVVELQE